MHIKAYLPDGSSRAIWSKPFAKTWRRHKVMPQRGSHVIAITSGPNAGKFHVDLTPLAAITNKPEHNVCLAQTFDAHEEAVSAEHLWLLAHWVCEQSEVRS